MSKEETILKTGWDDDSRVMAAVACLKAVDHADRNDIVDKASDIVALLCADFERGTQQLCADYKPSAWIREIAKGIGSNRARLRRLALTWLTGHFRPLANLFAGHALEVRVAYLGIAIWEAADRKFIEGWSSWRVSNVGLLNIGRQEGAQIIQLFGRGVRLKGKGFSLKRSSALPGDHPAHVRLLETLNIFAVRANYMALFRNCLEREGVETEASVELLIFAQIDQQLPQLSARFH